MRPLVTLLCLLTVFAFQQFAGAENVKPPKNPYSGIGIVIEVAGKQGADQKPNPPAMKISQEHPLLIKDILPNGPASKAGLQRGCRILRIDNASVDGLNVEQVALKIRGKSNTKVMITYESTAGKQKPTTVSLVRGQIQ